ncbi:MAG: transglutaminase domain-containing protein, partial [Lentisphaerae bacterium]|nr:transglutaminase domain-containing protein [Lentisphaerota bacterium]
MTRSTARRSCFQHLPQRPRQAIVALALALSAPFLPAAPAAPSSAAPPAATAPSPAPPHRRPLTQRAPEVLRADLLPRARALAADLAGPPPGRAPSAAERQRIEALQSDLQRLRLAWLERLHHQQDRYPNQNTARGKVPVNAPPDAALAARAEAFHRQVIQTIDRLQAACDLVISDQPARRATGLRRLLDLTPARAPAEHRPGASARPRRQGRILAARSAAGLPTTTTLLDVSPLRGTPILLAARGDVAWGPLRDVTDPDDTGAPVPGDLAIAAPQLSAAPAVEALAQRLETPADILDHVRRHVAYEPYFGAVKGAERVLLEGSGNDVDIASALISLLRSAGVPCRYVYGTIRLTALQAAAWLGVAPDAVPALLAEARLPHRLEGSPAAPEVVLDHV